MKNYWVRFIRHIVLFVVVLFVCFWLGYFSTEYLYNNNNTAYVVTITSSEIKQEDINATFFKDALAKYDQDGNLTGYSYASVKPDDIFNNNDIQITNTTGGIEISILAKYFKSSSASTITSDAYDRYGKVISKVMKYYDSNVIVSSTTVTNYTNGYLTGLYSLLGGIIIYFIVFSIIYLKVKEKEEVSIYNNETIFKTPFHKAYWKCAISNFRKPKVFDLCLVGILFALQMICKFIHIPSGFASLGLGITYLVFAAICMLYGPVWGLLIGMMSDILGELLAPSGYGFYFGYTIQAMLSGFIYGICLYRTDVTFGRCLLARVLINFLMNVLFGSWLWAQVADLTPEALKTYMLFMSLPKNIIYLIPQTILLYSFLRLILPLFKKTNIIPFEIVNKHQKQVD